MKLKDTIDKNSIEAKKSGDRAVASVLTMVRSAIKNLEIEKKGEITDDEILSILTREVKHRKEAITQYRQGGREELAQKEEAEIKILTTYLPEQMSEEEIKQVVDKAVADVGAESPADIGKVMGKVMPQFKGKADGTLIKKVVQGALKG